MRASAYIGRCGGLAVALGIGIALSSGSGLALADADGTGPSRSSSSSGSTHTGGAAGSSAAGAAKVAHGSKKADKSKKRSGARHSATTSDSSPTTASATTTEKQRSRAKDSHPHTTSTDLLSSANAPSAQSPERLSAKRIHHLPASSSAEPAAPDDVTTTVLRSVSNPVTATADSNPAPPTDDSPLAWTMLAAASRETLGAPKRRSTAGAETATASVAEVADDVTATMVTTKTSGTATTTPTETTTTTAAQTAMTLTALIRQVVYSPIHTAVQLWILSDIGRSVGGFVNALAGSYVIGNGADGTRDHPDGGAAGWLLGDGGRGWDSTEAGISGGTGGRAGLLGNGGDGGHGGAGADGGAGGSGGRFMGVGGGGGNGGNGTDGGAGGVGGRGGGGTGVLLGVGGDGGDGGAGSDGGRGGTGGNGARWFGSGGDGGNAGDSGIGEEPVGMATLGGAGGTAGWFGSHGAVGRSGSSPAAVGRSGTGSLPAIAATGTYLTNSDGQVVILHGANVVYKIDTYDPATMGFGGDDAALLAANGFNVVRLGIVWAAVEPEPGVYNTEYLASINQTVETLAAHGIYTLLDMHQDSYSSTFGGEGAPEWATKTGGLPNRDYGFPGNYYLNAAQDHAWDAFWANSSASDGLGLEDHYALAWEAVAGYFSGNSNILGYDIMNEPFVGSTWPVTLIDGAFFGYRQLTPLYNQVAAAIRAVDPSTALIVEPANPATSEVGAILGAPLYLGTVHTSNVVLAFHCYCAGSATSAICGPLADAQAGQAEKYGKRHDMPVIMDEFGASKAISDLEAEMNAANKYLMSWSVWAYTGTGDITTSASPDDEALVYDPSLPPVGDNVNTSSLATLAAPYPQLISGTPNSWTYTANTLEFSYSTEKADGSGTFPSGALTVISVPAIEYPNGYRVSVTGGQVISTTGAAQLIIAADDGATTVSVVVAPGTGTGAGTDEPV